MSAHPILARMEPLVLTESMPITAHAHLDTWGLIVKLILMTVNLIHARMVENAMMVSTNTPATAQTPDSWAPTVRLILMSVLWLHVSTTQTAQT